MQAADVMVRNVVTAQPETTIADATKLLVEHDISALPVIDASGALVGIISEGDLMHRVELGTAQHRPRWIESLMGATTLAEEFTKSHGKKVGEIMTERVVAVSEDTPLAEIVRLFERERIKRVPVTRDGKLVGIVSRTNLIQALASVSAHSKQPKETDQRIRQELLASLEEQSWTDFGDRNVIVHDGVVHLWGLVGSEAQHTALIALAESIPGVKSVSDEMIAAY
jgi:CBS domain-containing protein